jgi:type II secretory pathway pseudopilin PulG
MKHQGFTLFEVLVFIIITSLLMSVLLLGANTALRSTPAVHQQWVAIQSAQKCMEWYLEQTRLFGYNQYACPATLSASACTVPSGYSVSTTVACTTWNSDTNYKTITVNVSGLAGASLAVQIGED